MEDKRRTIAQMKEEILKLEETEGVVLCPSCGNVCRRSDFYCDRCRHRIKPSPKPSVKVTKLFTIFN